MKTGNKNQAIILAVIAVGAVAFLVIQLLPAKIRPTLAGLAQRQVVEPPVSTDFALTLVGDPFSHPKLATKPVTVVSSSVPSDIDKSAYNPIHWPGLPEITPAADPGSKPAENAGEHRQKPQGPQITVVAVMQAGTP